MPEGLENMSAQVLIVDPNDASCASMARALGRAGFNVVKSADTMAALDVLDAAPRDTRSAVVRLRQAAGKPHGLAFALMMRVRDKTARIVLLIDRPQDMNFIDNADKGVFAGILVSSTDNDAMAAESARLLGSSP